MPLESSTTLSGHTVALSWQERFINWRNRKLADPNFHRWARKNPFTRLVARKRARDLFDIASGFVYSQTLSACVELNLFPFLADGAKNQREISVYCGLDYSACNVLLRSAVSLRLLQAIDDERYALGVHGAALLANPGVVKMVEHHAFYYRDMKDPVSLLRREHKVTMLSMFWNYSTDESDPENPSYTELMSASHSMIAEQILDSYPIDLHQCVLDVGGSDGSFLRSVSSAAPDTKLMLLDLLPVVERAKEKFEEAKLPNPVECVVGDIHRQSLPTGADLITLIRVVHDHDDEDVLALLKRCRKALPQGGTLLIAEPMSVERVGDPATDAYFGFYLHAMGRGRPRTPTELGELLERAGFSTPKELPTHLPMLVRVLTAKAVKNLSDDL